MAQIKSITREVYPDKGGKYRWRVRASNGKIVASSGESFHDKRGAKEAAKTALDLIHDAVSPECELKLREKTIK